MAACGSRTSRPSLRWVSSCILVAGASLQTLISRLTGQRMQDGQSSRGGERSEAGERWHIHRSLPASWGRSAGSRRDFRAPCRRSQQEASPPSHRTLSDANMKVVNRLITRGEDILVVEMGFLKSEKQSARSIPTCSTNAGDSEMGVVPRGDDADERCPPFCCEGAAKRCSFTAREKHTWREKGPSRAPVSRYERCCQLAAIKRRWEVERANGVAEESAYAVVAQGGASYAGHESSHLPEAT